MTPEQSKATAWWTDVFITLLFVNCFTHRAVGFVFFLFGEGWIPIVMYGLVRTDCRW